MREMYRPWYHLLSTREKIQRIESVDKKTKCQQLANHASNLFCMYKTATPEAAHLRKKVFRVLSDPGPESDITSPC